MRTFNFNRRLLQRVPLKDSQFVGTLKGATFSRSVKILDASVEGLGFETTPEVFRRIINEQNDLILFLGPDQMKTPSFKVISNLSGEKQRLGLTFRTEIANSPFDLSISSSDDNWDLIQTKESLDLLFSDLIKWCPETNVTVRQSSRALRFRFYKMDHGKIILKPATEDKRKVNITLGPLRLHFMLYQCCYAATSEVLAMNEGGDLTISLPNSFIRILRRKTPRQNIDKPKECFISFRNLVGEVIELQMIDFSENGILAQDSNGLVWSPLRTPVHELKLHLPGRVFSANGEIRSVRRSQNGNLLGFSFEIENQKHRRYWHDWILRKRYRDLVTDYEPAHHARIWNLFDRSGYTSSTDDEESETNFREMKNITVDVWNKLIEASPKHSRRILLNQDSDIKGHLQMDRYYPDTWCVHHLAIDRDTSKLKAKDLYSLVTDVLSTENAKYLVSFHRPDLAWNQRNYYDFIESYPFRDHHDIQHYFLHYVDFRKFEHFEFRGWNFQEATKYDLRRIEIYLKNNMSELELKALGLDTDISLMSLDRELNQFGLYRGRVFFVATFNGVFKGFCRAELGTLGVNVVRLFDGVYFHPHNLTQDEVEAFVLGLLSATRNFYQGRGHHRVLVPLRGSELIQNQYPGLSKACYESRWIASCAATRRYQAYSATLFGRLIARRYGRKN